MSLIRTLKHFAFSCLALCCATLAKSQTNANPTNCQTPSLGICTNAPVTNSFASSDEGFTGSGTTPILSYNSTNGNLAAGGINQSNTQANKDYTLTSPNFNAAGDVTVGFTLGGTASIGTITIDVLNTAGTVTLASCQLTGYNAAGGSVCFKFSDIDLAGQTVKFKITLRTRPSAQNGSGTLTFDDFRVVFADLTVTPVTFAGFEGRKSAKGLELTWKVGGEVNVERYEVERSTNSTTGFVRIGSVTATGNSSYSYTDGTTPAGTVFYRIKNVDRDGRFKYSTILAFRNSISTVVFRVVPTLVVNKAMVQHPAAAGTASISLSATDGRTVRTIRPATGAIETSIDMTGLQPGLYLLKWSNGNGQVETTKVVKQ